jgi:hypothetical protein
MNQFEARVFPCQIILEVAEALGLSNVLPGPPSSVGRGHRTASSTIPTGALLPSEDTNQGMYGYDM